jgi:hypothetical protein
MAKMIARPYMGHGTAELAELVAANPDRETLAAIAFELTFRERPKAKALAAQVSAILNPAPVAPPVAAPAAAPAPVKITLPPPAVSVPRATPPDGITTAHPDHTPRTFSLDDILAATPAKPPAPPPVPAAPIATPAVLKPPAPRPVVRAKPATAKAKVRADVY